jgi:hypothetical protein
LRWASAYAAGLNESALSAYPVPDGSGKVNIVAGSSRPGSTLRKLLAADKLQEDQLVVASTIDDIDVMFSLPNRRAAYVTTVPESARQTPRGALTAESGLRVSSSKMTTADNGRPVLLITLVPQWTEISASGLAVATNHFNDVPVLDEAFAAVVAPREVAKSALKLDPATIDLLAASAVGDKLSTEASAYLVMRRWQFENNEREDPGYRFFVGKRRPTPEETARLAPQFIAWAAKHVPALPARVTLQQPIRLERGRALSWSDLGCFQGNFNSSMSRSNVNMAYNSELGACWRAEASGKQSPEDKSICIAMQAALISLDTVATAGAVCVGQTPAMSFANPLVTAFRFIDALPSPQIEFTGQVKEAAVEIALDVTKVFWSQQPPQPVDVLPPDLLKALSKRMTPWHEFQRG